MRVKRHKGCHGNKKASYKVTILSWGGTEVELRSSVPCCRLKCYHLGWGVGVRAFNNTLISLWYRWIKPSKNCMARPHQKNAQCSWGLVLVGLEGGWEGCFVLGGRLLHFCCSKQSCCSCGLQLRWILTPARTLNEIQVASVSPELKGCINICLIFAFPESFWKDEQLFFLFSSLK